MPEVPGIVGRTLACQCHKGGGECKGAVSMQFPTAIFLPNGALEYRLHRARFVDEMMKLYDETAEGCRQWLNAQDPLTLRLPLERYKAVAVDASALRAVADANLTDNAVKENDDDEIISGHDDGGAPDVEA